MGGRENAESLAPDVQKLLVRSHDTDLDEQDLGDSTLVMRLLVSLVSNNHDAYWRRLLEYVKILERLARNQDVSQEYTYYDIRSPWIQVKTMRALQYFPTVEDPNTRRSLFEVLQCMLMSTDVVKNVNKNNASHVVLFEALALVGLYPSALECTHLVINTEQLMQFSKELANSNWILY